MSTLVTREAPDFTAQAVMPDGTFAELKLSSLRGMYVVLFFHMRILAAPAARR